MLKHLWIMSQVLFLFACWSAAIGGEWTHSVEWQGTKAVIRFTEPLIDSTALPGERPFSVMTGPYLSWLTDSSARISWEIIAEKTILDTSPYFVGGDTSYPFASKLTVRSADLTGLKADSAYQYGLASSGPGWTYAGPVHTFRTFPSRTAKKFRFAIIGDSQRGWYHPLWPGKGGTLEELIKINRLIKEWNPPMVLHLGDLTLEGSFDCWRGRANYIGVLNNLSLISSSFMVGCLGNHDGLKFHSTYFSYLTQETPAGATSSSAFYSFDVANIHFVCVTGYPNKTTLQGWLDPDLRDNRQQWTMAYSHYPYHSIGYFNYNPTTLGPCALLNKYRVPIYFSGHDHSYQRTARITNDTLRQLSDSGTVHVVSGGAGSQACQYSLPTPKWNLRHMTRFHYIRVEVEDSVVFFTAIDTGGTVLDRWKMALNGQPETLFDGPPFEMADDRDTVEVKYNNPWTCTNAHDAVWTNPSWLSRRLNDRCHRSHSSYSITPGDHVTFTFTGTSIAWIGSKSREHGLADVYIDGVLDRSDVDAYANVTYLASLYQQVIYEKTGLAPGTHTVKIVVTGRRNTAASDCKIDVDAFKFTPTGTAAPEKPSVQAKAAPDPVVFLSRPGSLSVRVHTNGPHRVTLVDPRGRVVRKHTGEGPRDYRFSGQRLAAGVYCARVWAQGRSYVRTLVLW